MTDHHDPLDELASAYLDGETTDAEATRIAADPDLVARVEHLAAAREALRAPDAVIDEAERDNAIAAALAVFDAQATGRITSIAAARRSGPSRRTLQLVGIAAAAILLALAVPLIGNLGSGSSDKMAADIQATDKADDDLSAAEGGAEAATTTAAAGAVPLPDLGSFAELPALADIVRSQLGPAPAQSSATASSPMAADAAEPTCPEALKSAGALTVYVALAELAGQPVVVIVSEEPDGGRTLTVLNRQGCTTVTARRL
jgi:hypothetical protein